MALIFFTQKFVQIFGKKFSQFFSHPKIFANNFAKNCSNIFNPKICANNWAKICVFLAMQIFEIYKPELGPLLKQRGETPAQFYWRMVKAAYTTRLGGSPRRYVLKIHFFIELGLKMIQFKTKSRILIQKWNGLKRPQ